MSVHFVPGMMLGCLVLERPWAAWCREAISLGSKLLLSQSLRTVLLIWMLMQAVGACQAGERAAGGAAAGHPHSL